ncbi:MAG: hypothetical protein AAGF23_05765 [Acidobacteriota bacterium]
MKLRTRGQSVRLRLERHEVDAFARDGVVEGRLELPGGAIRYGLRAADVDAVGLGGVDSGGTGAGVHVLVPSELAESWATGDEVGFEADVAVDDGEPVRVLVEKDFRCLHKRPGEDESGQYPHPAE